LGPAVEDAMLYELFMIRKLLEQLVEGPGDRGAASSTT